MEKLLLLAYSHKGVGIVTEWITDHNDTNKHNNFSVKCLKWGLKQGVQIK